MRRGRSLAAALASVLLAGCVTSLNLRNDTLGAPPGSPSVGPNPGYTQTPGYRQTIGGAVQWQGSSLGSAVVAAAAAAVIIGSARGDAGRALPMTRGAPPELDPGRTIHEQDCGKPIENPSANLRCR